MLAHVGSGFPQSAQVGLHFLIASRAMGFGTPRHDMPACCESREAIVVWIKSDSV